MGWNSISFVGLNNKKYFSPEGFTWTVLWMGKLGLHEHRCCAVLNVMCF